MSCYLISYDLRGGDGDYDELHETLKEYPRWAHVFRSTWLVDSHDDATEIRDDLSRHLDADDGIIVSKYAAPAAWANPIVDSGGLKDFVDRC